MRSKLSAALLVALLCCGAALIYVRAKRPQVKPVAAGSPMAPYIHFQYAVYMMPVHTKEPEAVLRHALAVEFPNMKLVSELRPKPHEMLLMARMERSVQKKYSPPGLNFLQSSGEGLSEDQKRALQGAQEAFILDFAHPKESVWPELRTANELVEKVARETGGLVWDEETREVYSPDAWHKQRIGDWREGVPNISTQTVVHVYQNGEFLRAISLGMTKAGLPDVVVEELPEISGRQVGILIDLLTQSMAEGKGFSVGADFRLGIRAIQNAELRDPQLKALKRNALGTACLTLKEAKPEEGDPENRIIEIAFDGYAGKDKQAKQDAALSWLFGWEDAVTQVEHTDALMEESRKEKTKLAKLQEDFDAGLKPGEYILVKAPFKTLDGGREWMWVEIRNWKKQSIKGVLENEPEKVPGLQAGQVVDVQEADLFDYIRHYPDGHDEGNTTGPLLSKMEQERRDVSTATKAPPPSCAQ